MNPYLLLIIFAISIAFILLLFFFKPFKKINKFKVLSVILFVSYAATLGYSIIKGGKEFAIDKYYIFDEKAIFVPGMTVFMVLLRTFTTVMVATSILSPFYENIYLKKLNRYLLPVVALLNVIFLENNLIALFGINANYFANYRGYAYVMVIAILTVAAIYNLVDYFIKKEYKEDFLKFNRKMFFETLLMLVGLSILYMQQGSIFIFFGSTLEKTKDFSNPHRFYLVLTVLSIILPYLFLKKKSQDSRNLFFGLGALAGFFQYFYVSRNGLSGLPLHLCNTAIVMMFLAYVFKLKGVFYFSYFVNVLGAIFAIVMPNTEYHANHIRTIHFWLNHILAFALPVLGVSLGVYERPNLKMMLRAIGFFTLYFLATVVLNGAFNSEQFKSLTNGVEVDYFFTYSDFFIDKVEAAKPLKYDFIWEITVDGAVWKLFPVYQITIYVVFVALMFVIWLIYDYLYQVSDRHYDLLMLKKMRRQDLLELRKLQMGDSINEPVNKEAIGMIKIENFTKQYAGAKKPSVEGFNLTINDGEVFGFIGHNGSGKSTTIKSMVGIQSLTSGSIIIDGYDISKQPLEAKLKIGYVSDNHAVYEKLTGREYVNYVADLYLVSQEDRDARIEKYVKMFNLEEAFDREIKGYSHGMKQKLVVIASLIHNPKVWILDEPLTGLDPTSAFQIKECMREHANNGNIVFFSSHVIEVVEKICDRICIIQRGKIVGVYTLKDLGSQGLTLEQLYMTHVANANYNTDAPDATGEYEKRNITVSE